MASARVTVCLATAGILLAGCGSSLTMDLGSGSNDRSVSPSSVATPSTSPTPPAPVAPPQIQNLQVSVRGHGELTPGKTLAAGSKLKVNAVPLGSIIELTRLSDTGTPENSASERVLTDKWTSPSLAPAKTYRLGVQAPDGSSILTSFNTKDVTDRSSVTITPDKGSYGVGMPIIIEFPAPVKSRADVQAALSVETSQDIGPASWYWPDSDTVMFRPRDFWPARTKITVNANLASVQVYEGSWGSDQSISFKTGPSVIMKESLTKYKLVYFKDGKKVETFPISGGMPGWETLNGIKIVHESYEVKRMVNNAPGAHYDVMVPYAMRLTYSGEFMHAAPWNGNIGYANTSHGCTNMTYDDAVWMYNHTEFGDVVITKGGAGGSMSFGDGLGGVWDVPWKDWIAGSALPVDDSTTTISGG